MSLSQVTSEIAANAIGVAPHGVCEARLIGYPAVYCSRRIYKDSKLCFWHSDLSDKYLPENLALYFGPEVSLCAAVETEVSSGKSLAFVNLRNARFGGSFLRSGPNLKEADFRGADLRGAWLSYSNLAGACLAGADLSFAKLGNCNLSNAELLNTRLFKAKFRMTDLETAKSLTRDSFRGLFGGFCPYYRLLEQYPDQCEPMYRRLTKYFADKGSYEDASWAAYRASVMRHRLLKKRLRLSQIKAERFVGDTGTLLGRQIGNVYIEWSLAVWAWAKSLCFLTTTGYGEKPGRVVVTAGLTIVLYSLLYALPCGVTADDFSKSLYFSIATFTTLGYGDIVPTGNFRLIAGSEALIGIVLTGLFLFCLGRRTVSRG